jgi:hypothetical protein
VYLVVGTAVVCLVVPTLLGKEASPFFELFGVWAPIVAVLMWLHRYARTRRIAWAYDWGYLFWVAWPLCLPIYAVRLEGRRQGWRLAGWLTLLSVAPGLLAGIVRVVRAHALNS